MPYRQWASSQVSVIRSGDSRQQVLICYLLTQPKRPKPITKRWIAKWRLLLLDGCGSYCTKVFLDFRDDHHTIRFYLPPYSTHLACFQPYMYFHATRTGWMPFREQTFKRDTIPSDFRQTGLIPFDLDILFDKLPPTIAPKCPAPAPAPAPSRTTDPGLSAVPLSLV